MISEFKCDDIRKPLHPKIDEILEPGNNKSFIEILDEIYKIIYSYYLNPNRKEEDTKDHDSIINSLKNIENIFDNKIAELKESKRKDFNEIEISKEEQKKKASKILLTIMEFGETLEK